jgi:dihydrofolate reductase
MRKVKSGLFVSLDGVAESPEQWQFDSFDADMGATLAAHIAAEDTVMLGRVTYQEWVTYWPGYEGEGDEDYGVHINKVEKVVVSTTLKSVEWQNARLLQGSLADEVARLKALPGKNIGVVGSPTLVRTMLQADLLDELTLMIHPVVAGKGKRLFADGDALKRLKLASSKITSSGVALLTYERHTE